MRGFIQTSLLVTAFTAVNLHAAELIEPCAVPGDTKSAEWRDACTAAIDDEKNATRRAKLFFGRAYGAVEENRFDDALKDLGAALEADPENPRYLHERAYVNGELSNYPAAIADLDLQISQQPSEPEAFSERAYARHFAGDLAGAYKDRARIVELDDDSPGAVDARAEAAMWLGRFDEAAADVAQIIKGGTDDAAALEHAKGIASAIKLLSAPGHAARCTMRSMTTKDASSQIADCTRAFLDARDGPAKADALTYRSIGWQLMPDDDRATDDAAVAVGLDPGNPDRLVNLGFLYIKSRHSWAAERMFARALAIKRSPMAMAGHAEALSNLGQVDAAFKEALESFKLDGNEAASWLLADMAFDRGDRPTAKQLYLSLYRRGSRDDRLMGRLKELGVTNPAKAAAVDEKTNP